MEFEIEISKRNFFIVFIALFIFSGIILTSAYNTRWNELPNQPTYVGHSPDEIEAYWSKVLNVPSGFADGSDAGVVACSSGRIRVGNDCKVIPSCNSGYVTRWDGNDFKCLRDPPPPPPPATYSWKSLTKYNPDYNCATDGSRVVWYNSGHLKANPDPDDIRYLSCAPAKYRCYESMGTTYPRGDSCSASQEGDVCISTNSNSLIWCRRWGDNGCIGGRRNKEICSKN